MAKRNLFSNIIGRLVLSATVYFIWQERNLRIHNKGTRSVDQVFKLIFETIRCKVMSLRFKATLGVREQIAQWNVVL